MWDVLKRRGTKMRAQERLGAANNFYRGGKTASDRAQDIIEKAVKRGIIKRPLKCEKCGGVKIFCDGRSGIQGHHPDYNKPLEVMWLCQPCHNEWHRNNRAIMERRK